MDQHLLDHSHLTTGIGSVSTMALRDSISTSGFSWGWNRTKYAYDGLNRLVEYSKNGTPVQSYEYDRYGNLTTFGAVVLNVDTTTNRISEIGGLSVSEAWDDRGNLTWVPQLGDNNEQSFVFSGEDRLIESTDMTAGVRWRYAYDASGERVLRWLINPSGDLVDVRFTLRDEGGQSLTDWLLTPGATFGPSRAYLYAGDRLVSQLDWTPSGIVERYIAADHLGSTRFTMRGDTFGGSNNPGSDESIDYLPFGEFDGTATDPFTTHLFTGHERDLGEYSTGLDYMHARYYSSNLGRFLSTDPVGGSVGNSQSWNRYSYVNNNPILMVDPDGRAGHPGTWIGAAIGFAAGLITASAQETLAILDGQQKTFGEINRNLAAGALGGMATGAIAGSCGGCNLAGAAAVGSGAAVTGGGLRRAIDAPSAGTDILDPQAMKSDAIAGAVGGSGGHVVGKTVKAALAPAVSNQQMGAAAARAAAAADGVGITGQSMAEQPFRAAIEQMTNIGTATGAVAGELASAQASSVMVEESDEIQQD